MLSRPEHPIAWLEDRAADAPDVAAIRDDDGELSYGELWRGLGSWYAELADDGLENGRLLAVLTGDRRRMARAVWLALYAGCPVLPLDPLRPATLGLIDALEVPQVIADGAFVGRLGARTLPASVFDELPARHPLAPSPRPLAAPQLLITTSGTEGAPKAVMLSARGLSASATSSCELFDLGARDRWLCCLPVIHVGGLMILFRCARAGATVELRQGFDPTTAWADLQQGVTHTSLAPVMLHCILEAADDPAAPETLRHVLMGGSPLPPTLGSRADALGWPLTETYGMSETATHVAIVEPGSRGLRPIAGCGIDLVDLGAGAGEPGRLRLEGPTMMVGYANPTLTPGDGLDRRGGLLTADLGRRLENGMVRVVGREDDVIICGGMNIHPVEVEQLCADCPDVDEIAITGRDDPVWGQQLAAVYTGTASPEDVAEWVERHLPGRFRPRAYHRVEALPKNPMGKLRRDRLGPLLSSAEGLTVE